jgi:Periplasmic binding protein
VLDELTIEPAKWVARLAPAQSHSWSVYADFLLRAGHRHIAVATQPSVYWASGARILRSYFHQHGGTVVEFDMESLEPPDLCERLVAHNATVLLVLVGYPEPAVQIVRQLRSDARLAGILIGAPAGQPEFGEWEAMLGADGAVIPFLRYLPSQLTPLGLRVESSLRARLGCTPSFVAFEGYDTVAALSAALRGYTPGSSDTFWSRPIVEGTRGQIRFTRVPGINVWQWAWPAVQVVERDPIEPARFRVRGHGTAQPH